MFKAFYGNEIHEIGWINFLEKVVAIRTDDLMYQEIDIEEVTLLSNTEVKDSNGRDIYEGDELTVMFTDVENEYSDKGFVVKRDGCFILNYYNLKVYDELSQVVNSSDLRIEIIGNIFVRSKWNV